MKTVLLLIVLLAALAVGCETAVDTDTNVFVGDGNDSDTVIYQNDTIVNDNDTYVTNVNPPDVVVNNPPQATPPSVIVNNPPAPSPDVIINNPPAPSPVVINNTPSNGTNATGNST